MRSCQVPVPSEADMRRHCDKAARCSLLPPKADIRRWQIVLLCCSSLNRGGGGLSRHRMVARCLASPRLVNEPANHQGQQIYFGIAATDGHDTDVVCIFERNSPPAFAPLRGRQASPRYAGMSAHTYLAV